MSADLSSSAAEVSSGKGSGGLTPERIKMLAECLIAGLTRVETAQLLNVSPRTVSRWKPDPAVAAEVDRLRGRTSEDRAVDALEHLLVSGSEKIVLGAAQVLLRRSERAPKEPAPAGGSVVVVADWDESLLVGDRDKDPRWRARIYNDLGYVIHDEGEPARAREYYRIALEAATEICLVGAQLDALLGIAATETEVGDPAVGARLFGRMKELASVVGAAGEEQNGRLMQQTLERLETALGSERLAAELAAGAALPLGEAIDLARAGDPATSDSGEH
jgi:Homeodomain-like domain